MKILRNVTFINTSSLDKNRFSFLQSLMSQHPPWWIGYQPEISYTLILTVSVLHKSYLCKNTKINVGSDRTWYKLVQSLKNIDAAGNRISPIDQNSSNNMVTKSFARPPVISDTRIVYYIFSYIWIFEFIIQQTI